MSRIERLSSRLKALAAAGLLLGTGFGVLSRVEAADDIELLRERGGQPFVMVMLDTSSSMAMSPSKQPVPANADDPGSKLYQVKKAMYEVFSQVENVNFGFVSFNQDRLRVRAKHWLYTANGAAALDFGVAQVSFPRATNDQWVLGAHFSGGAAGSGVAGTCTQPLSWNNDKEKLDRFAKIGLTGGQSTVLWAQQGARKYRFTVTRSAAGTVNDPVSGLPVPNALGSALVELSITGELVAGCGPVQVTASDTKTVVFRRSGDFLMVEADGASNNGDTLNICSGGAEGLGGYWTNFDPAAEGTCGSSASKKPFTGQGSEMNNDSGARSGQPFRDQCCVDPSNPGVCLDLTGVTNLTSLGANVVCSNLRFPTSLHPQFAALDSGDQIPLDWNVEHREDFLQRINPRHPEYDPANPARYFSIANYFQDQPDSTGFLPLRNQQERPLVGFGQSPLARAINDFRCFMLGGSDQKCGVPQFPTGWLELFEKNDLWYGCRVPYLFIVTDGEDNTKGENPTADVADFRGKAGVRTFVFTFEKTGATNSLVNPGDGEVILIADGDDFRRKLEEIVGLIQQESRTFASAAVPSVQSAVEDKIYLTNFRPLNEVGVWEGHFHSFRRPITSSPPSPSDPNHLWDAATVMLAQSPSPGAGGNHSAVNLQLGPGPDQRRVYYTQERVPGFGPQAAWSANRRSFDRSVSNSPTPLAPQEPDFWAALDLAYEPAVPASVLQARARANRIVEETLVEKTNPDTSPDALSPYILGDVFHSDPLILGGPVNTRYFIEDAEETFDGSGNQIGTGYREFFFRHENRRKVVLAGANDGQLHAFDGGKADVVRATDNFGITRDEVRFDNGSGRELFSWIPRMVMPTVKLQAENPKAHRWSVDGAVAGGDVFIDPRHTGTPTAGDREWRTVVIGGLREGGVGYYALDLTHPDELTTETIGPVGEPEAQRQVVIPSDLEVVPDCHDQTGNGTLGCDDVSTYPAPLWEFTDRVWDNVGSRYVELDEDDVDGDGVVDGNQFADLAETWSVPDIGRIKVNENGSLVTKYVAVFGGGLDPAKSASRGNFLYMVDVETGEAIYKRQIEGSAPADPAAVDIDQDGFFDRVYIGTTAGLLYRLDLANVDSSGNVTYPTLVSTTVRGLDGATYPAVRFERGNNATRPLWQPRKIFSTAGRPIYYRPSILFVANLGQFAVAFGTGDRDDLTSITGPSGRFYVFVDETDALAPADLPMIEARFEEVTVTEGDNSNLLTDPGIPVGEKGWYLTLDQNERLIGAPFGFSGITFFATFETERPEPSCEITASKCENPLCSLGGDSRIYVVGTTDADAFLETSGVTTRYREVQGQFVTSPFREQAVSRTGGGGGGGGGGGPGPGPDPGPCSDMQKLYELFPPTCKFGNHRIDIKVIAADTEIQCIASVPICIVEKNWKELSE